MSFIYIKWLPLILIIFFLWLLVWSKDQRRFQLWIKNTFNLKIALPGHIHRFFFCLSVLLFALALLDLRGPEKKIEVPISDQKTVILIDASSSMSVEDVQPNRFKRALTVARHFVKNALGHQISIIVFSDISKRVVPFTDDIDLLDARLAGLDDERLRGGGSNISQAIAETIESFRQESKDGEAVGNILLLTDAEENGEEFKFENVSKINLGIVGIGTVSGGKIPMRTKGGTFTGYKTYKEKEVISKLDEKFLEKIGNSFSNFKKWIVLSFNLPTEEVLSFFRDATDLEKAQNELNQNKMRPVRSHWLVASSLVSYIISILFGQIQGYRQIIILALVIINFGVPKTQAQTVDESRAIEAPEKEPIDLSSIKENWSGKNKENFAYELAQKKSFEEAATLYEEAGNSISLEGKANWGTSLLAQGKEEGLKVLKDVLAENKGKNVELERAIHSNIKKYYQVQSQKQKGEGENKDSKDKNKENESKGKSGNSSSSGDKKDQKGESGQDQEKKDDGQEKSKDENDQNEDGQEKERKITNRADREREIDKKRRMMKVPALLKQLMQDDRALQNEFIDTATQDRDYSSAKKDW